MAEIVRIQERLAKGASRPIKADGAAKILLFTGARYERRQSEAMPSAAMTAQLPAPRSQAPGRDPAAL
ncbi:MAG: hypothetical protein ACOH2J_02970 [Allorhizobium sp.]